MEDKIFEFMTKMYSDLSNRLDGIDNRLDGLDNEVKKVGNHVINLENGMKEDIKALYDGYKLTYEKIVSIENKMENQDVEIRVIKGGK